MALTQISTGMLASGDGTVDLNIDNGTFVVDVSTSRVGIGGTPTDGTLHVHTATAGTVAASTQADDLVIENSAEGGMTIITPDDQSARIRFTSPSTNNDVGGATIFYRQNINRMNIGTEVAGGILTLMSGAGSETMRLDASGKVGISTSDPKSTLEVKGTFGAPATSGSAAGFISRFSQSSGVGCLDFGFGDPYSWIQSRASNNYATNFDLVLQPNGGNVGIGSGASISADADADNLVIQENGAAGITIGSSASSVGSIRFADSGSPRAGMIYYNHVGNEMRFYTNATEAYRITAARDMYFGQTSGSAADVGIILQAAGNIFATVDGGPPLLLRRNTSDGEMLRFSKNSSIVGTISTNANSLPSDRNFKTNINYDFDLGLEFVTSLKPVTYNYKIDNEGAPVMSGLIAQDVEESLSAAGVEKNSMTMLQHIPTGDEEQSDYQMDYLKLVPVLINAIQELKEELNTATARITELENN
jgi:hypothetical protein